MYWYLQGFYVKNLSLGYIFFKGKAMYFKEACIFSEFPLDPCDNLRANENEIEQLLDNSGTRFIAYRKGEPLMINGNCDKPNYVDRECCVGDFVFLGQDDGVAYFAGNFSNDEAPSGAEFMDMRSIARQVASDGFSKIPSLLARGKMILDWHDRHQFCANCGSKSEIQNGGYKRYCENCDTEHFPRVDPVVIMTIVYGEKCLLGRSPHFLPGMYSALAGFMEPGETIEEAVRREVWEEAGIRIGEVSYIKSQPWPFPSSLMIGVVCEALNDDINIDPNELEDAKWFKKDEIAHVLKTGGDDEFRVPEKLAIARHLLEYHLLEHWTKSDENI